MRKTILRSTGFEFASTRDLGRDEEYARYRGDRGLLLRVLQERQRRRWPQHKRESFAGLGERWYEDADRREGRVGLHVNFNTPAVIVDENSERVTLALGVGTTKEPVIVHVDKTDPDYGEQ